MIIDSIISRQAIEKGWSSDKKYCVTASDGKKYLLRISPCEKHECRKRGYEKMCQAASLGISMAKPIEFGVCDEGVYTLESFIEGVDGKDFINGLPSEEQYAYGLEAGRILAKLHTIPAPEAAPEWEARFNAKIDRKIAMYAGCKLKYENDQPFLSYIAKNRHLLADRPQTYQHGDYHIGNMMVDTNGMLTIIDFDRDDYGDPWEEFNRIVWCAEAVPAFASGMVDGYFEAEIPPLFWQLLALYICSNTLSSLPWAVPFGEDDVQTMRKQADEILLWYDNMTEVVPTWYKRRSG